MSFNEKIYVVGPIEVLQELYPDYSGGDVVDHGENSVYEVYADKVIPDLRVRNLTHAEILKEIHEADNDGGMHE